MPISREEIVAPRRSSVSPRAISEPAYEMNCPGAIDRRGDIRAEHAVQRVGERNTHWTERGQVEMRLEPCLRLLGRNNLEELLLPGGGAHRIEQRSFRARPVVHGNARISRCAPAGNP